MATCSLQDLLRSGACFCGVTASPARLAKLALLCEILQHFNPVATCSLANLMQSAQCFCGVTTNPYELIELQLLCEILAVAGTGGGSGGQIMEYTGVSPTADGLIPTNTHLPAMSYKRDGTGPIYGWNTVTLAWV